MKTTNAYGLPYPEINDFGNGALDLQVFAEAADTQLAAVRSGLLAAQNTAGFILTTTADQTGVVGSGSEVAPFSDPTQNFWATGATSTIWTSGVIGQFGSLSVAGSYMFGAYMNLTATGTVNAGSVRMLTLAAAVPANAAFTSQKIYSYRSTAYEPNVGIGSFLCVSGMFDFQPISTSLPGSAVNYPYYLNALSPFWLGITSGNTGSNLTIKANAKFWVVKVANIAS